MPLRITAIWLLLLFVAVINGAIRETFMTALLRVQTAHIVSTALLCAVIFIVAWFSISWIGPKTGREALSIGIQWAVLTVAFEFLAGHYFLATHGRACSPTTTCFTAASGFWSFSQTSWRRCGYFAGCAQPNAAPTALATATTASASSRFCNPVFVLPPERTTILQRINFYFVDNTGSMMRRSNSFSNKSTGR